MERKIHYHGYTVERTIGPNGGMYQIWDGPEHRVDRGAGFNTIVEAQIYINRMETNLPYFGVEYQRAYQVAQEMLDYYLEHQPENAAYFSVRAAGRFAEAIAEQIAILRSNRTGEDLDLDDEIADNLEY